MVVIINFSGTCKSGALILKIMSVCRNKHHSISVSQVLVLPRREELL